MEAKSIWILTRVEFITVPFPSATPIARANVQVKRLELEALNPRSVVISRIKKGDWSRGNGCAQKKFGSLVGANWVPLVRS